MVLRDLNKQNIVNYADYKIDIYASKENIEKLENNYKTVFPNY